MAPLIGTQRLQLVPVAAGDVDAIVALMGEPDIRRCLCDDRSTPQDASHGIVAESLDPGSITSFWRIALRNGDKVGLVGLRPLSTAALALRAIGWRSLDLRIALEPRGRGRGVARECVEAVAQHAGQDGVTFALVASVEATNERGRGLMMRCGFRELGRVAGPEPARIIYERAV